VGRAAVTGDGGMPVFHRAYDGGAGEVAQVVGALTGLKDVAGSRQFLLLGDSTLVSYGNLAAMVRGELVTVVRSGHPAAAPLRQRRS
jgi:transposase